MGAISSALRARRYHMLQLVGSASSRPFFCFIGLRRYCSTSISPTPLTLPAASLRLHPSVFPKGPLLVRIHCRRGVGELRVGLGSAWDRLGGGSSGLVRDQLGGSLESAPRLICPSAPAGRDPRVRMLRNSEDGKICVFCTPAQEKLCFLARYSPNVLFDSVFPPECVHNESILPNGCPGVHFAEILPETCLSAALEYKISVS